MKRMLIRIGHAIMEAWYHLTKPLTLGVKALIIKDNEVLLVRHTYKNGWFLPGGHVDRGESFQDALVREVREECGLECLNFKILHVFFSTKQGKKDHVALYEIMEFRTLKGALLDPEEIEESRFFPINQLPLDLSPATKRRLNEIQTRQSFPNFW